MKLADDPTKRIGKVVLQEFGGCDYPAVIIAYMPPKGEESALWHVQYEDGDGQDLEEKEVRRAIQRAVDSKQAAICLPDPRPPLPPC